MGILGRVEAQGTGGRVSAGEGREEPGKRWEGRGG
jgi:hypothetical protein